MLFSLTLPAKEIENKDENDQLRSINIQQLTTRAAKIVDVATNHDSVTSLLSQAYELAISENDLKQKIVILNIYGLNEYYSGNYEGAVDYYYQVLELSEQSQDSIYLAKANHNLGMVYESNIFKSL